MSCAQVPVMRAIWFMKITAVYVSSISKKRNTCVALEWTKCISEYLKDNLAKFAEHNVSLFVTTIYRAVAVEIESFHNFPISRILAPAGITLCYEGLSLRSKVWRLGEWKSLFNHYITNDKLVGLFL